MPGLRPAAGRCFPSSAPCGRPPWRANRACCTQTRAPARPTPCGLPPCCGARWPAAKKSTGLRVLWITPMRALAADTLRALEESAAALAPGWTVGARTGDTSSAERARQSRKLPSTLVTTPESLSLLLSHAQAREQFASLDMIIIDEWHELMGTKRGVQVQLALARLRHWNPELVVWALSATMGNLDQARTVLLGEGQGVLVEGDMKKQIVVDSLVPPNVSRFPWGGHLGIQMLQPVIDEIEQFNATLVF